MKEIKILIIEDDKMIAEAVSDIVETLGYRPIWATAGPEALEKASQEEYDLAILDLELPRMPGIEVAEKLMVVNEGLRILFTTGTSDQEELIETITHLAFYAGWPNSVTAVATAKEVFENPAP